MKPKKTPRKDQQRDLFRTAPVNIIDPGHGLVKLSKVVERERIIFPIGVKRKRVA